MHSKGDQLAFTVAIFFDVRIWTDWAVNTLFRSSPFMVGKYFDPDMQSWKDCHHFVKIPTIYGCKWTPINLDFYRGNGSSFFFSCHSPCYLIGIYFHRFITYLFVISWGNIAAISACYFAGTYSTIGIHKFHKYIFVCKKKWKWKLALNSTNTCCMDKNSKHFDWPIVPLKDYPKCGMLLRFAFHWCS